MHGNYICRPIRGLIQTLLVNSQVDRHLILGLFVVDMVFNARVYCIKIRADINIDQMVVIKLN